jgi:undecaprenyl-diphosphatase
MMWIETLVLSVVEGVTEFLPVSSTGHMILAKSALGLESSDALNSFLVIVQAGAILAVVTLYFPIFLDWFKSWICLLYTNLKVEDATKLRMQSLSVAFSILPFGVLGLLLKPYLNQLFSYRSVALALIVGGLFILVVERILHNRPPEVAQKNLSDLTLKSGILIGLGQCLALWPGFSRSAATLLTARLLGFERSAAAEVSFLLGLPTLLGAATYESVKSYQFLTDEWIRYLIVGIVVAWITAFICVKLFVAFLKKYPLAVFAYYRIVLGSLILIFF